MQLIFPICLISALVIAQMQLNPLYIVYALIIYNIILEINSKYNTAPKIKTAILILVRWFGLGLGIYLFYN
jgi:hypothetical protein